MKNEKLGRCVIFRLGSGFLELNEAGIYHASTVAIELPVPTCSLSASLRGD